MNYVALIKAKEASARFGSYRSRDLSEMEKQAMWNGFFDELDKISFRKEAQVRAQVFFEKQAKKAATPYLRKTSGVKSWFEGKVHKAVGEQAKKVKPYVYAAGAAVPLAAGAGAYFGARGARRARAMEKSSGVPAWVVPTMGHFAAGAVPGAVGGAVAARPGEKGRGAARGAVAGGAAGVAGGHLLRRLGRDAGSVAEAARKHRFNDFSAVPKAKRKEVLETAKKIKGERPLYGRVKSSAAKKDDRWERPSDSFMARHKGKVLGGGLAAALGAGVAHKLYHRPSAVARRAARSAVKDTAEAYKAQGGFKGFKPTREVVFRGAGPYTPEDLVDAALGQRPTRSHKIEHHTPDPKSYVAHAEQGKKGRVNVYHSRPGRTA